MTEEDKSLLDTDKLEEDLKRSKGDAIHTVTRAGLVLMPFAGGPAVQFFNEVIKSREELKWFDGPGPGYSEEEAIEHLKVRYEKSIIPIKQTLKRLSKDPGFISTVDRLRADGWLDWHILLVINNIAVNYRVEENMRKYPLPSSVNRESWYQTEIELVIDEEESENSSIIPVSKFNEDELKLCLHGTMLDTIMRVYGLECRQMTPDINAIEHFLGARYNYWKDDIEHDRYF